ncbi:MAG: thioredoxin fold domain-containing protein [Proteobacteria bacterium]|nr:thioredoxin family protein [Desulfobacula sp.]MBU0973765.1 thioredoxin fold domain-containing protein [Pseudomonadota bacterium]
MKKNLVFKLTLYLFIFMTGFIGLNTEAMAIDEIKWNKYDEGLSQARKQNKKILLYFHADWCKYCKLLEKTTFKNQKVVTYLNDNYINISANSDIEKKLAKKFGVRGVPAFFFLGSDSNKIDGISGYVEPEIFLKMIKFIHTDSYQKMSFSDYAKTI